MQKTMIRKTIIRHIVYLKYYGCSFPKDRQRDIGPCLLCNLHLIIFLNSY